MSVRPFSKKHNLSIFIRPQSRKLLLPDRRPVNELLLQQSGLLPARDRTPSPIAQMSSPITQMSSPITQMSSPESYLRVPDFASQIDSSLFLGSYNDMLNVDELRARNITEIISVAQECPPPSGTDMSHLHFSLRDDPDEDIELNLTEIIDRIDRNMINGIKTLICCRRGISRSAFFVIAYYIIKLNLIFDDAYELVQRKRPIISPNFGFILTLEALSDKHHFEN